MCIAIYKPEGYTLLPETLETCWDNNPDGAGFMYAEKNKLIIVKGLMSFVEFLTAYTPHENKQLVLHFRIATHGKTNQENTHPFSISKNLGLIHNGIINKVTCDINKDMSDTWHFIEKYIKPFQEYCFHPQFKELIEDFIGHNKFILLNNFGEYTIYNESSGSWNTNCWFSNQSYIKRPTQFKKYNKVWDQTDNIWETPTPIPTLPKERKPFSFDSPKLGDRGILKYETMVENAKYLGEIIKEGTEITLLAYGAGNQIFITDSLTKQEAKIPIWHVEQWLPPYTKLLPSTITDTHYSANQEIVFTKNYNHFRIGDIKPILNTLLNTLSVYDSNTKKSYLVPKTVVEPLSILLH